MEEWRAERGGLSLPHARSRASHTCAFWTRMWAPLVDGRAGYIEGEGQVNHREGHKQAEEAGKKKRRGGKSKKEKKRKTM